MMIDSKLFYETGFICFAIIAVCSVANFFIFFKSYNFFSAVASLAQIIFNFVITGFFYFLLKTQTSSLPVPTNEDLKIALDEALKEFNKVKCNKVKWVKKN